MSTGMRSSTTTVSQRPSTKNLMAWIPCSTHEKCTSPCRRPGFAAAIAEGHRRPRHCYRREGGRERTRAQISMYQTLRRRTDRETDRQINDTTPKAPKSQQSLSRPWITSLGATSPLNNSGSPCPHNSAGRRHDTTSAQPVHLSPMA